MSLRIDPRGIPDEGLQLEGTLPPSVFGLSENDVIQPVSPVTYDLFVTRDDEDVIVAGSIAATFDLECGRCAERFGYRLELPHYGLDIPLENEEPIDLTTWLREDILLALPTHPRCETGNVTPRQCPAEGRFEAVQETAEDEPTTADARNVWGELDKLNNLKRN